MRRIDWTSAPRGLRILVLAACVITAGCESSRTTSPAPPAATPGYLDAHNHGYSGIIPFYAYADLQAFIRDPEGPSRVSLKDRRQLWRYLVEQLATKSCPSGRISCGAIKTAEAYGQDIDSLSAQQVDGALERVLTATPWTEFDSAYAIRGDAVLSYSEDAVREAPGALPDRQRRDQRCAGEPGAVRRGDPAARRESDAVLRAVPLVHRRLGIVVVRAVQARRHSLLRPAAPGPGGDGPAREVDRPGRQGPPDDPHERARPGRRVRRRHHTESILGEVHHGPVRVRQHALPDSAPGDHPGVDGHRPGPGGQVGRRAGHLLRSRGRRRHGGPREHLLHRSRHDAVGPRHAELREARHRGL